MACSPMSGTVEGRFRRRLSVQEMTCLPGRGRGGRSMWEEDPLDLVEQ